MVVGFFFFFFLKKIYLIFLTPVSSLVSTVVAPVTFDDAGPAESTGVVDRDEERVRGPLP